MELKLPLNLENIKIHYHHAYCKGEETNRVEGFESGADDYIVKPFSPRSIESKGVIKTYTNCKH